MSNINKLYRFSQELNSEILHIIENEGEVTELYDSLVARYPDVIDQLCEIIHESDSMIDAAKKRIEQIQSIQKQNEKKKETCKNIILNLLPALGTKTNAGGYTYKTESNSIHTREGGYSVVITDVTLIPEKYLQVEVVTKAMKDQISKALKEGKEITGCSLKKGETVLVIK